MHFSLRAGRKRFSAPKELPPDIENMLRVSSLKTIWPSLAAAEKRHRQGNSREARHAAGILVKTIMNVRFIIEIITHTGNIGAGEATARGVATRRLARH
jgi:hypothetical protein